MADKRQNHDWLQQIVNDKRRERLKKRTERASKDTRRTKDR